MEEAKLQTLEQIKAFLDGTSEVAFRVPKEERNHFIERVLKRFGYTPHGRVRAVKRGIKPPLRLRFHASSGAICLRSPQ